jgi:hypothetical protein
MEYFVHLGEHKRYFVLQQGTAVFEVAERESLAHCLAAFFGIDVSKSEQSTVAVKHRHLVIQKHFREETDVCVLFVGYVVEARSRVVCVEPRFDLVQAFCFATFGLLVPLK